MKQISDKDAQLRGIHTAHHEMDNGEQRFRLISDSGSAYVLTRSTGNNGWQRSHVHHCKSEFYLVEKGCADISLLVDGKVEIIQLSENDSYCIQPGTAHNILLSDGAVLHTIKYGSQDEDWYACPELDKLLDV